MSVNTNYNYTDKELFAVAAMVKDGNDYEYYRTKDFDVMATYVADDSYFGKYVRGLSYDFESWEELRPIFAKVWIKESLENWEYDDIYKMMLI